MRKRRIEHPFLIVDNSYSARHKRDLSPVVASILYHPVHMSCHHLYPKARTDGQGKECHITLKIWCYKHFYGWNNLFQFFYKENGKTIHSELTIDEIITCMVTRHPFIMEKVGSIPWQIVFKDKNIEQAINLLCRMLYMKLNRAHIYVVHRKIDIAIPKKIAA